MDSRPPFFRPGGTMDPNAPSYIEREADAQLLAALIAGEYVFLLDSRQKGKSSMVARTIVKLREQGIATVKLDLQRIGANVTPEQWYAGMLNGIGQELNLTDALFEYWQAHAAIGPLARWIGALQEVVLAKVNKPAVIFIDEIDFVRALSFSTDEFFAAIRDCYNRRSDVSEFKRLAFCLVGVATPGQLIRNPEITPFNIGTRIELTDFTETDLAPFAQALSQDGRDGVLLASRIYYWVHGHPYLTQLLCSHLAGGGVHPDVDSLVSSQLLSQEARQREPNLSDIERRLLNPDILGLDDGERRTQVLELYRRLLKGKPITTDDENPLVATLKLSGVSRAEGGALVMRNRLYGSIFGEAWVQANLPDAETRRQRKAALAGAVKVATVSACVLAVFAGVAAYTWTLSKERSRAVEVSRRLAAQAERNAYNISMFLLSEQAGRGNWIRATEVLRKTRAYPGRGWEWHFWDSRLNSQQTIFQTPKGHAEVAFLKDGSGFAVVTPSQVVFSTGEKHDLRNGQKWQVPWIAHSIRTTSVDIETAQKAAQKPQSSSLFHVISRSGELTAELTANREVLVGRSDGTQLWTTQVAADSRNTRLMFDAASKRLGLATDKEIYIFDCVDGSVLLNKSVIGSNGARFSSDGSMIAVATNDAGTHVFDVVGGKNLIVLRGHTTPVIAIAFSPDDSVIATGGFDGTIRLHAMPSGRLIDILVGHSSMVEICEFSDDGNVLVSRAQDGEVRAWPMKAASAIEKLSLHTAQVVRLEISSDGTRMATSSRDQTVVLYDLPNRRIVRRINAGAITRAHAIAFSKDGKQLAVSLPGGGLGLFNSQSGSQLIVLRGHSLQVNKAQFSNDGLSLLTVSDDGTAKLWITIDGRLVASFEAEQEIMTASMSGEASHVAVGLRNFNVELYAVGSKPSINRWKKHEGDVYSMEFSPDGSSFASTSYDGTARVYNVRTGKFLILPGDPARLWEAQYSADGSKLLVNSYDGTAKLWNTKTGELISVMRHDSWVAGAEFSPDQSRVITCSDDKTIRIWDAETGDELTALRGHTRGVFRAKMSPNQEFIASASSDGTVRLWHARRRASD